MKPFTVCKLQFIPNASKIVDDLTGMTLGVVEPFEGLWLSRGVTHDDVDVLFLGDTEEEAAERMYESWAVRRM